MENKRNQTEDENYRVKRNPTKRVITKEMKFKYNQKYYSKKVGHRKSKGDLYHAFKSIDDLEQLTRENIC
jgi:hypothetical protein